MTRGTVLITGSSKGLGKSIALEFASRNYNLIIHGRDEKALYSVEKELAKINQKIEKENILSYQVIGDIREEATLKNLEARAKETNLDILVNNAGIYLNKKASETSEQEFRDIMETDFFAQVNLTKRILPIFKQKGGIIVNINSVAGVDGGNGEVAYAAAKHAFNGFSKILKEEVIKDKIKIIDFFLGATQTEITRGRANFNLLMKSEEVARYIAQTCEFCQENSSCYPKQVFMRRCNYE